MVLTSLTDDEYELIKLRREREHTAERLNSNFEEKEEECIAAFKELYPTEEYALNAVPSAVSDIFAENGIPIISTRFPERDMRHREDWCVGFNLKRLSDSIAEYFDAIYFQLYGGEARIENISDWISTLKCELNTFANDYCPSNICKDYGDMTLDRAVTEYKATKSVYDSTLNLVQKIITQLEETLAQEGDE